MKSKGFTLIELLAVIVILAIIALIAVPIILNIIDSTKKSANERSKELYLDAVEQAIARENLKRKEGFNPGECRVKDEEGNLTCDAGDLDVEVNGAKPNVGGTITFEKGKIKEERLVFGDGTDQSSPENKKYYSWSSWNIGGSLPTGATTTPPEGRQFYLGFDVEGEKVSTVYVCFIRNETEYCLKGADTGAYDANVDILNDAFLDVENACTLGDNGYNCKVGNLDITAEPNGSLWLYLNMDSDDISRCEAWDDGSFDCYDGF